MLPSEVIGVGRAALAGILAAAIFAAATGGAAGQDGKKYPAWEGKWKPGSPVLVWDPSKPPGLKQEPPLTPEYQAIYEQNLAKGKTGEHFDSTRTCGPSGMPRVMTLYVGMEIVIKPNVIYMLIESTSPVRRIYTDGRDWTKDSNPQFLGYSIGRWFDTDGDGTYNMLEVETRNMRGPRLFDSSGVPLHSDNETIVKEKIYLDKSDPNILRDEITTFDHALTRPWTVSRFYRRELNPIYEEYPCTEDNHWVAIGGQLYFADGEGYLMPIQRNQPPPDPKYLQKHFRPDK
jgi:hypothetical protein